ncbi:MAM domain-containing glycosylphosphatidylinositol anchor protein 1 [Exaiptasia diaphana]|uniref:MAM domain-containing protein n=1 Tax=Exaiptasia diaphana TaxID=2652724 RepID=A0A913YMJ8_EXADI|nr:MAM domain-containing glycosylphosphatidylinositol anchor protein 1 [Exaiptasia diaphana]
MKSVIAQVLLACTLVYTKDGPSPSSSLPPRSPISPTTPSVITEPLSHVACDFNDGSTCNWKQIKTDNFDWTVNEGPTPESNTGPEKGSDGGKYAYIRVHDHKLGENATLILRDFRLKMNTCFSLMYHMFGQDIETLEIRQDGRLLMRLSGPQGNKWKQVRVHPGS